MTEAEAYARCHGSRDDDVRIVKLEPRRPHYRTLETGERLRELFEQRLDSRDPLEDTGERGLDEESSDAEEPETPAET